MLQPAGWEASPGESAPQYTRHRPSMLPLMSRLRAASAAL